MDEQLYMDIAMWLTNCTESGLERRFGKSRREVPPTTKTDGPTTQSEGMEGHREAIPKTLP